MGRTLPCVHVIQCHNYDHIFLFKSSVALLASQWRKADDSNKGVEARKFIEVSATTTFGNYYDETQDILKAVSGMDPLLEGSSLVCI